MLYEYFPHDLLSFHFLNQVSQSEEQAVYFDILIWSCKQLEEGQCLNEC